MKILIVSQYFWPENFKINDIALGLKERGHEVSVLTAIPNYPQGRFYEGYSFHSKDEEWEGIKIYRSKIIARGKGSIRLFINYLSFVFFGKIKVAQIKGKFDSILVYEPSPITVGLPAIAASNKFGAPYYFWVQDLWPQSLTAAGGVKNPLVLKFFDKITKYIYNKSEKVLVQSHGFKQYIKNQDIAEEKIIFYPNSTESFYTKKEKVISIDNQLPSGFRVMFAGNLGEAQSLNTLIESARLVKMKNTQIKWILVGDGRAKKSLIKKIFNANLEDTVYLVGSYPSEQMPDFFSCADVLIASLRDNPIFSITIPSKIQSYLACGKPILAALNGEGANIIDTAKCGFSSKSEDSVGLAENVMKMYNLTDDERTEMGENAVNYFKENFEREMLLERLEVILKS